VIALSLAATALTQAGCAARRTETQMKFLLDELTIVREELQKYPPQIRALEQQVRAERRVLQAEITSLREQLVRLERRLAQRTDRESPPTPAAPSSAVPPGSVLRLGPGHYRVSRSAFTRASLMRAARIVPSFRNGRPNGFKLFAIRPGSALRQMGLENGDTVLGVNGQPLTSPDHALRLYSSLRTARELKLELMRRGRSLTLRYTLVP